MTSSTPSSTPPANPLAPGTVIPIFVAIGVFGTLYGAAAQPHFGSWLTMFSSIVIFSGSVLFSLVGLLAVGAGPLAIVWAIFVVNVRNFALGGALRPHLTGTRLQRLAVSWFLIDETVGLALASPSMADRVLLKAGAGAYLAWVVGTAIGVAGGAALGLAGMASAVFPVLFIGLAALMVRSRGALVRAGLGVVITVGMLLMWPGLAGLAPVIGGIVAAIPAAGGE
jgi:predicted branched-subunit amino acid permease